MADEEKKGWFQRFRKKEADADPVSDTSQEAHDAPSPKADVVTTQDTARESMAPEAEKTQNPPEAAPDATPEIISTSGPEVADTASQSVDAPGAEPDNQADDGDPGQNDGQGRQGWYNRLKQGLKKSTSALSDGVTGIFTKRRLDDETLEELEELLITADLGVNVAGRVAEALSKDRHNKEISDEEVKGILAGEIEAILAPVAKPIVLNPANKPHVILMAGVNGAGKTTTIGKLGKKFKDEGKRVMLAAGDTFRAAAVEQLQIWGERVGVPVITKEIGSDAAALAFEAMDRAISENMDVLLIDTAGRLQNREELMAELAKVVRVIGKKLDGAPHDTIIVLDATTGQNAVHQVEVFQKLANISGIVMTKLDGSARGGVLVACADKFGLPVHAVGVGEAIEDLQPFDPREFARALVGFDD